MYVPPGSFFCTLEVGSLWEFKGEQSESQSEGLEGDVSEFKDFRGSERRKNHSAWLRLGWFLNDAVASPLNPGTKEV